MGHDAMDEHHAAALGARFLRPAWPRLEAAREVVAACATSAEAWERLAARDVIPAAWLSPDTAPRAGHTCVECGGSGDVKAFDGATGWMSVAPCDACNERRFVVLPHPASLDAVLALAADPAGVTTAEALVREYEARLSPWGADAGRAARPIVWRTELQRSKAPWGSDGGIHWRRDPNDVTNAQNAIITLATAESKRAGSWYAATAVFDAYRAAEKAASDAYELAAAGDARRLRAIKSRYGGAAWPDADEDRARALEAAAADVRIAAAHARLRAACVAPYTERPDPYEPLLGVWALGYGVDRLAPGYVVLYAPAPGAAPGA